MYLVSATEPRKAFFKQGIPSSVPEEFGCDLLAFVGEEKVGAQIKTIPEDFIASIEDGRLQKELSLMKQISYPLLILEGQFKFVGDELVVNRRVTRFTKEGIRNLLRSCLLQFGVPYEYSENAHETVQIWESFLDYIGKPHHNSLKTRPKAMQWGGIDEQLLFFIQGLPRIGYSRALALINNFGSIHAICNANVDDLAQVEGIGEKTARTIYEFIRRRYGQAD